MHFQKLNPAGPPKCPEKSPWVTALSNPTVVRLIVIVKLRFASLRLFRILKTWGRSTKLYFGLLRFEERCISEKCLAMEDAFEITNFLNGLLHDVFRGSCLPECYDVELSWYGACFYEAWNVAELLNGVLDRCVLNVQQ